MRIVDCARPREPKEIIASLFDLIRLGQFQCSPSEALNPATNVASGQEIATSS